MVTSPSSKPLTGCQLTRAHVQKQPDKHTKKETDERRGHKKHGCKGWDVHALYSGIAAASAAVGVDVILAIE